jgi:PleD family two-component response regulator
MVARSFGGSPGYSFRPGQEAAGIRLECVRDVLAAHHRNAANQKLHVTTITIGATQYLSEEPVEALTRRADMALYLGKETGRDRVVLDHELL